MTQVIDELQPIGLEELVAVAELQTRRERKYLVPLEAADAMLEGIVARALDIDGLRRFRYESIYFDTQCWDSYLGAARRRPRRFKVRTRTYVDSNECMLEVKVRDRRGNTVKHRLPYEVCSRRRLTDDALAFIGRLAEVATLAARLQPVLTVAYRRSTLLLEERGDRVTIDRGATWSVDGAETLELRGLAFVETKTAGLPSRVDRLLWRTGHRPVTVSKYCAGLALARTDLPSNKWHRLLGRHLIPNVEDRGSGLGA
jgi:hypothetical protein